VVAFELANRGKQRPVDVEGAGGVEVGVDHHRWDLTDETVRIEAECGPSGGGRGEQTEWQQHHGGGEPEQHPAHQPGSEKPTSRQRPASRASSSR
jgi:hypothetical protein